ncbi:uncharacterized protein LOC135845880 isoform X4 [Planococcus citri]|uniref:uncharacterized protein LOC135845880 isoform X4 n=1 Tax=Planococcus citri TaxID=170843 RepID=UPI0031FA11EC
MIGTFWNLCRACPSMPIDKNRSEYRSTYQWYEYTGPRQEVVKQAPQLTSPTKPEDTTFKGGIQATLININKNPDGAKRTTKDGVDGVQPEVNIKKNPIYGKKDADFVECNKQEKTNENSAVRVRSARNDKRDYAPSRRSKSEGPPGARYRTAYGSPSPDFVDDFDTDYVLISNYPEDYDTDTAGIPVKGVRGNTEYRLQFAWPRSNKNEPQEELKAAGSVTRRSAFMAPVTSGHERPPVPVHKKRFLDTDKKDGAAELEPLVDHNGECDNDEKREKNQNNDRLEFYSEYKKKFRPFSQYDYIAGKFLARDNSVTPASSLTTASWYSEVVELRKKAGEYKHRGWGTELVPQHLAEVYNKQIALWEHVSRRSSLSALTLATTTQKPRALTKEEKGKENSRKLAPHRLRDVSRQTSVDRSASVARKKTEKNEEIKRHSAKLHKEGASKSAERPASSAGTPTSTSTSLGRSHPVGGSPKKFASSGPASASSPKKSVVGQTESRARPKTEEDDGTTQTASKDAEDTIEVERIVKSPPEPTRVKSPEQMMVKSPEPVNWTVPLDTGKTFTVTQNIHDGDLYHHRPPSEARILSTLHHGPHSLDSQNITSHKSLDDSQPSSLDAKLGDLSLNADVPNILNGSTSTDLPSSLSTTTTTAKSDNEDDHQQTTVSATPVADNGTLDVVTKANGNSKYTEEEKPATSPVSEHSDSNHRSITEEAPSPAAAVAPLSLGSTSTEVLDSARNRFEEFWSKPKYELNGKESSM